MTVVCHIISGLATGGAERALWRLLANGLQGAYDNHVVCLANAGPIAADIERTGAPVHVLNLAHPAQAPGGIRRIRRLLSELRPALLQGWMYHGNLAALAVAGFGKRRPPVAWNIRQGLDDIAGDKFATRCLIRLGAALSPRANAIVYNSARSAAEHEAFGYARQGRELIPNGFEVNAVRPDRAAAVAARRRYGISDSDFLFAHVARWHPMKDHAGFIAAAARCAAEEPTCRFLLAGRDVSGNAEPLLAGFPREMRDRFQLHDEIAEPLAVMQAADALVVSSSRAEGFPNVLGEAMMTATPCIATDVGDSAQVVGDGGLVVPAGSPAELAGAMLTLARDPAAAAAMGQRARARVEREFAISAVVARYCALYERLIGPERAN
jgi:glycosyltransferase involved in cell wall biosynthesis